MKRAWLCSAALILWAGASHAAMLVTDPIVEANTLQSVIKEVVAAGKRVEMVNNQIIQIQHLVSTVAALSHGNLAALSQLSPELGALGLTNPLGTDTAELVQALSGLGAQVGSTGLLAQEMLSTDRYYAPSAGDFRAIALNQASASLAQQKALAELALQSSTKRLTALTTLRNQLGSTADVKAAADAGARLAGEQATAQAQTNQLIATQILANATAGTSQAREAQAWRCSAESMVAQAKAAYAAAQGGAVTLISTGGSSVSCSTTSGTTNTTPTTTDSTETLVASSTTPDDGTTLGKMLSQSWGAQAASNAAAVGVNPTALAATCVMESNCSTNVGGSGTISGVMQMSNGAFNEGLQTASASGFDTSQLSGAKNDALTQSVAASGYLKQGAQSLQARGIADPTVLDVRGYYQFGPTGGAAVASASDAALISQTVNLSPATLAANGLTSASTVGQWRQSVTNKIGSAASQSVLIGRAT